MQLDALREVGNIGAGNAATALSKVVGKRVKMEVPLVKILPLKDVPDWLGGPEKEVLGVYLTMSGAANGHILFVMTIEDALKIMNILLGDLTPSREQVLDMDEIARSAMEEIGNILSSSYLSALADFTGLRLNHSVPALAIDMAGAIVDVILIEISKRGDYALLIETEFVEEENKIKGYFMLIPDTSSLEIILQAIGVI
ncbi:MAG TPA: chemotaxis protein CheC [Candidatus Atribacteria bacterium]|uniref:chemotaxis protein CheC n=1 Tax=Candidatus Sordicultor fermentans TaxID=1953203 RepID=UPI0016B0A85C|nr:chemotaxis protein CheC [Candidatus Atribacteria bacterium]HPT62798.1 chemotaxis protein CheC [Candidatus Atribacteria bacterium]